MNNQQRSRSRAINPVVFCLGTFFVAVSFSVVTCFSIFSAVGGSSSSPSIAKAPVTVQHTTSLAMVK
ncbi:MAG: hypothetical protein ABI151_01115 [Chitinophagaceae bacterium]